MEEEIKEVEDTGRDPKWHGKKNNCVINIFCDDMKPGDKWDGGKNQDGNCIINIFCKDKKHDDKWDGKEHDGNCIVNIFCNKKHEDLCEDGEDGW